MMTLLFGSQPVAVSPVRGLRAGLASLALTLALTVALTGCAGKSAEPAVTINQTVVVTRGDYDKTYQEFVKRLNLDAGDPKEKEAALKHPALQEQLKQMAFNKLIFSALLANDAKTLNVSVSDADLKAFKEKSLAPIGGEQALDKVLKAEGMSRGDFDSNLRDELLIKKFIEAKAARDHQSLVASDADAKRFYQTNQAMFNQPEGVRASHILFKAIPGLIKREALQKNPKASESDILQEVTRQRTEKKRAAQQILAQVLKTPADFEKLAREKSDDVATGMFGGNLNMLTQQSADPLFWRAAVAGARTLKPADKQGKILPQVVESMFGYHVVRVTGYRPAGKATFAQVLPELREQLGLQKRQAILMSWMGAKRQNLQLDFAADLKPQGFNPAASGAPPAPNAQAKKAADAMGAAPPPTPATQSGG